jgi:hypothetical protein
MATRPKRKQLVTKYAEMVSSELMEERYQEIIRERIKGRHGVYALYLGKSLQYVGLTTNLRTRLERHRKDPLAGKWDKFSIYLTKNENLLKDLETLVLHIATKPPLNKNEGKFIECEDMLPLLKNKWKQLKAQEKEQLFGPSKQNRLDSNRKPPSIAKPSPTRRPNGKNRGVVPKGKRESATRLLVEIFKANNLVRLTDEEIQARVVKAFPGSCWQRRLAYVNCSRWQYNNGRLTPNIPKEPARRWVVKDGKRVEFLKAANKARSGSGLYLLHYTNV